MWKIGNGLKADQVFPDGVGEQHQIQRSRFAKTLFFHFLINLHLNENDFDQEGNQFPESLSKFMWMAFQGLVFWL